MNSLTHTYGSKTDIGRVRKHNHDCLAAVDSLTLEGRLDGLFVVADGIGGSKGGGVASRIAIETVCATVCAVSPDSPSLGKPSWLGDIAHASLQAANAAVWQETRRVPTLQGMGTTCVLALLRDDQVVVGNVGDSRCYLFRENRLHQLTHDHAFLDAGGGSRDSEESAGARVQFRHVMTRAIGFASRVEPEVELFTLQNGDTLLLCSDGLSNLLTSEAIHEIIAGDASPQELCKRLVDAANQQGGDDNITAIIIQYGKAPDPDPAEASPLSSKPVVQEDASAAANPARSWRARLGRLLGR